MRIAPRLSSGDRRIPGYSGLPPELRYEIERVARRKKCSISWVIEQIILDWADIRVDYKVPMTPIHKDGNQIVREQVLKRVK